MKNPFNPGAGRKPPYLAGRDQIIHSLKSDMDRTYNSGEGARPVIVSGLRGMGKTVLLRELANHAQSKGWIVIWAEASAGDSLARKIALSMYTELRRVKNQIDPLGGALKHALAVLKSFQLKIDPTGTYYIGLDVDPANGYADSGDLSLDLGDLLQAVGEAAREAGTCVFLGVDELQEAPKEDLAALNVSLHGVGQDASPVPIYFIGAGLPTLPAVLSDATSYAERMYRYYGLDLLNDEATRAAFLEPTEADGISWAGKSLDAAAQAAGGYPYFIQQCGFCICDQADEKNVISEAAAQLGIALAQDEVDRGLYRSRWDRATPKGKDFMQAMAELGTPVKLAAVAKHLGKKRVSDISMMRDRLVADGLIYSPERGHVTFTVPGMGEYILRHP